MINKGIVVRILFPLMFTMFIHSYSILVYAQTFSMEFPPNGVSGDEMPASTDPVTGAETRMFSFFNPLFPDAGDKYDATIFIYHFPQPYTFPTDTAACEEEFYGKVNIDTIDFSVLNTNCDFVFSQPVTQYIIPDSPYNNWLISYVAEDQFSFNNHYHEFINSLRTLHLLR